MKHKAIICDIDGVLLDTEHIFDRITQTGLADDNAWEFFNRHANDHDVMADSRVIEILEAFANKGFKIIFLTARNVVIESQTRAKIDISIAQFADNLFKYQLYMRPYKCKDKSCDVKQRWLNELRQTYDIYCAIDDESENCEMFAKNNILTLKVHK